MSESISHPSGIIREFHRHEGGMVEKLRDDGDWYVSVGRKDFPTLTGDAINPSRRQALAMAIEDLNQQIRERGGR